jgi:citrate synthase
VEQRGDLTADQAADLLGVRLQTIYAYVSRGLLTRTQRTNSAGHRVSVFDLDEVMRLAAERTRVRMGSLEVLVETDVTLLDPKGSLTYRGHDAVALAGEPFEEAAELVWAVSDRAEPECWELKGEEVAVVVRAAEALGGQSTDTDRVRAAVLALASVDSQRQDLQPEHVTSVGRKAVAGGIAAIGGPPTGRVANRLWTALGAPTHTEAGPAALSAAMVLLLDHELAASTMAARIAAGTGADPWLVLLTGLGALGGPRHGGSSLVAERLLGEVRRNGLVCLDRYASDGSVPGFGHSVYVDADPRAELLLDHVARLDPDGWPVVEELLLAVSRRFGLSANVDLALAALVQACGLRPGGGETIFALSRMVGWLAHAMEEYPQGLRFRPRAVYTGEPR